MRYTRLTVSIPFLVFLVLASVFVAPAAARAQGDAPPRFEQQVVVTPTRSESLLERVPAMVIVLDRDDILGSAAEDIPGVLRQAGVDVVDVTGNQRSYRVDLRGFGATAGLNTLVLVDGRRVNAPDLSGTDWFQIPLERVSRIEIIPDGAGAVMFGDNASGGVVNIITGGEGQAGTQMALRTGSYATFTPEASTRGTLGDLTYSLSGRYHRSDGHRQNTATEGGDFGGQFVFRQGQRFELNASGGYHGDTTGLPGALKGSDLALGVTRSQSINPNDFAEVDDGYVMVTPRATFGPRGYALVDVSVRQRDSVFFSSFAGGQFTGETGTRTVAVSPRVVLQGRSGGMSHHFVAGGDVTDASQDISNTVFFDGLPDLGLFTLEKQSFGVYVQDSVSSGPVTVLGGYRYDHTAYSFAPSAPGSRAFDAHAGSFGATFRLSEEVGVFARASRSFRYPVLDELFDFFGNTIQTGITRQHSTDAEGGVRLQANAARASLSVFTIATDDEIFFNPAGGFGFGANENLDGASRRMGIRLAVTVPVDVVRLAGTYTLTDTSIDGGAYDGRSMPGIATHRATVQAGLPLIARLTLDLEGLFTGARHFEGDFSNQFGEQDSYVLLDAKLAYRQGRARLFVDLKNLLDEEYAEYGVLGGFPTERAFYPSAGRHAIAGIEIGL
jgi:iron complex outermembrane receptor protein